jgi:hypothetical protein
MSVRFRIVGTDLPGTTCGPSPDKPDGYRNIHVGVQRGRDVEDLVPGDAHEAIFEFEASVKNAQFAGPYIQGRGDQRFIYLSWGEVTDGGFEMFRRAKLMLDVVDAATSDGRTVHGALGLTDAKGHPTCAAVRPPQISWRIR